MKYVAVLLLASVVAAHAAPDKDALTRECSLSVDNFLRDPQSAEYQWWDADVQTVGNNSTVILPVRAENAYGGHVTLEFICTMNGSEVVKVRRLK